MCCGHNVVALFHGSQSVRSLLGQTWTMCLSRLQVLPWFDWNTYAMHAVPIHEAVGKLALYLPWYVD
jgi:hypothetical protein